MKKQITAALAVLSFILIAGPPVALKIKPGNDWKAVGAGRYSLPKTGGIGGLGMRPILKTNTFYELSWEAKSGDPTTDSAQTMLKCQYAIYPRFELVPQWNKCRRFFFSGDKDAAHLSIYTNEAKSFSVRNIRLKELAPGEPETIGWDFEHDNTIPNGWVRSWKQNKFTAGIEKTDFINGNKSMALTKGPDSRASVDSPVFPMTRGAKYRITFWAKGSEKGALLFLFNAYNWNHVGGHPRNIVRMNLGLEQNWKKFTIDTVYPVDEAKFPAVKVPMANLVFCSKLPKVWIDDISVTRVDE